MLGVSLSKQNYVECAHENPNCLWMRRERERQKAQGHPPMRLKISICHRGLHQFANLHRCYAYIDCPYTCASLVCAFAACGWSLWHSSKLNSGNYCYRTTTAMVIQHRTICRRLCWSRARSGVTLGIQFRCHMCRTCGLPPRRNRKFDYPKKSWNTNRQSHGNRPQKSMLLFWVGFQAFG